jgi:hypothetical protein
VEIGRRPHQVCCVSSGSPQTHWVDWLIHEAKTEDPSVYGYNTRPFGPVSQTDLTGVLHGRLPEPSKRRARVGIARLASRLSKGRSPGVRWCYNEDFPKFPSGCVS